MTMMQQKEVEKIQAGYLPKQKTKLDELKELDKKVTRPAKIFAYTFGAIGSLVLGTGMCLAMKVIGDMVPLGLGVGILGIAMVSSTYYLYKKLLKKRKDAHAKEIVELSNAILHE